MVLSKAEMLLPSANNPIRSPCGMDEMEVALRTWLTSTLSRLVIGVESDEALGVLGLNGGVDRRAGRVEEYALDGHLDIGRGFSDWTPGRWETARVRELDRRTEWNDLRVQAAVGHGGRAAVKPDCCGRRQRGCM